MNEKIQPSHKDRRAVVYLRQSTMRQLYEHKESTLRQYALKQRATELGWSPECVDVVDEDLGQSGSSSQWRSGFQRLGEDIAHGRVGIILAVEASRLARRSADWHRLLDLCRLADVLIADETAVYAPKDYNDQLLLGLKGTMAEAELVWMGLRMHGAKLNKARRGELFFRPAAGYSWDEAAGRFRLDPDEQVQRAVRMVFERFRVDGSANGAARYLYRHGILVPVHARESGEIRWIKANGGAVTQMVRNPVYAGAYVYGRRDERPRLVDGELRRRYCKIVPQEQWKVCLQDHHPAYISWEEFMDNQRKLGENRTNHRTPDQRGAARAGFAMLQGLVLCGRCGRRMTTRYPNGGAFARYECLGEQAGHIEPWRCWAVAAGPVDAEVTRLFLDAFRPSEIDLSFAVTKEAERQAAEVDRQWKLRLERLDYEQRAARRRYMAVDPDNRVVARTLEADWEAKLREIEVVRAEYEAQRRAGKADLSDEDRAQILALARDLPLVWNAESTTNAERKNLLRMVVREVCLTPIDVPKSQTGVKVMWVTGAVTEFSVPRQRSFRRLNRAQEVLDLVAELYATPMNDGPIAAELNRRGVPSGTGRPWETEGVEKLRDELGLPGLHLPPPASPPAERREDGLYSVRGVAKATGANQETIRRWVRAGLLVPKEGGGHGCTMWFDIPDEQLTALTKRRNSAAHGRKRRV